MAAPDLRVQELAARIGTECKALRELINGNAANLDGLDTPAKASLLAAINNLQGQINDLISGGGGLVAYDFLQTTPASTWIINHNLGRAVVAQIFNEGASEVEAEWQQVSPNQVRVTFAAPAAGTARIT